MNQARKLQRLLAAMIVMLVIGFGAACGDSGQGKGKGGGPTGSGLPAGTLKGTVVKTAGGAGPADTEPVAGARVKVLGTNLSVVSGADGEFTITGVPAGVHTVAVDADLNLDGDAEYGLMVGGVSVPALEGLNLGVLKLLLTGQISGKANLGYLTGNLGVVVFIPGTNCVAMTDDAGNYLLSWVPAGTYTVAASKDGYCTATVDSVNVVSNGQTDGVDLRLDACAATGDLAGTAHLIGASDSGGVTVSVLNTAFTTTTAADGAWTMTGLPTGIYQVRFAKTGYYPVTVNNAIILSGGGPYRVEDVYLAPDTTLDNDGDGIPDAIDPDDDNDGVPDELDAFPLDPTESVDTDGDGIGNNADLDDDNDGYPDAYDAFPLDPAEWSDLDSDGIGDNADWDDDADGMAYRVISTGFPVNEGWTPWVSIQPSLATDREGNYCVAWQSHMNEETLYQPGWHIFVRCFDRQGYPRGQSFLMDQIPWGADATTPRIAARSDGIFVVAYYVVDGTTLSVRARMISPMGTSFGNEFLIEVGDGPISVSAPGLAFSRDNDLIVVHGRYGSFGYWNAYYVRWHVFDPWNNLITYDEVNSRAQDHGAPYCSVAANTRGESVVVWSSEQGTNGGQVWAQRFSAQQLRISSPFRVDENSDPNRRPAYPEAAFDGDSNFAVVWTLSDAVSRRSFVYARRYDADGQPLGPEFRVDQAPPAFHVTKPGLAFTADRSLLIAWADDRTSVGDSDFDYNIYGRLYDPAGNPAGNDFRVNQAGNSPDTALGSVSSDGDNFLLAYADNRNGDPDVFLTILDHSGTRMDRDVRLDDGDQMPRYIDNSIFDLPSPTLLADGDSGFLVAWPDNRQGEYFETFMRRIDLQGRPWGNDFRLTSAGGPYQPDIAMAADGGGGLLAALLTVSNAYLQRFRKDGSAESGPIQANQNAGLYLLQPALAVDGNRNAFLVWTEAEPGRATIVGRRFDAAGQPLGDQFDVSPRAAGIQAGAAALAIAGSNTITIVWYEYISEAIFARRFDAAGLPLGDSFMVSSPDSPAIRGPAVAVDSNDNVIVAWSDSYTTIEGQAFDAQGWPLGDIFTVSQDLFFSPQGATSPHIAAYGGGKFIIVWNAGGGIAARGFASPWAPLGNEFPVSPYWQSSYFNMPGPKVALLSDGNLIFTWYSFNSYLGAKVEVSIWSTQD